MFKQFFRRKALVAHEHQNELARTLTSLDLTLMGIGAIIGAGIFVLTGIVAATKAGPAVVISYGIAGLAALFSALAYAELAASVGGSGSAYSYAYTGFGELIAWIIGWNLLLEYIAAVSTVAIGWSGYVQNLFQSLGFTLPKFLGQSLMEPGGFINLPAVVIILLLTWMLCLGVKQGARLNAAIVFIKLATILFFIIVASFHVDPKNWSPFAPFGFAGVISGAALVFFAYIGFDALSTAVEETINPQRDIPRGIIFSLLICTLLYIIVSLLLTGIVPYQQLHLDSPVAYSLLQLGYRFAGGIVAAGAIAGLTSVMLVMFYGASRIILAMARDGLLPKELAQISQNSRAPRNIIIVIGLFMAILAGLLPLNEIAEMVNIGTLAAFAFVCAGVSVFRRRHPELLRPFKLPYDPLIPVLGTLICIYLMLHLATFTWIRFIIWTFFGLIIYFLYGMRSSNLNNAE